MFTLVLSGLAYLVTALTVWFGIPEISGRRTGGPRPETPGLFAMIRDNLAKDLPDLASAARGGYGASDTTRAEVGAGERLVNAGLVRLLTLRGRLKAEPSRHVPDEP